MVESAVRRGSSRDEMGSRGRETRDGYHSASASTYDKREWSGPFPPLTFRLRSGTTSASTLKKSISPDAEAAEASVRNTPSTSPPGLDGACQEAQKSRTEHRPVGGGGVNISVTSAAVVVDMMMGTLGITPGGRTCDLRYVSNPH